jgi:dTDP-glucose 4,6-dehydratase
MRVLITGAAGFLGSHLTDRLLTDGHVVVGVDNLSTGTLDNLSHLAREQRFSFEERDICLPFDPGKVDYVFNFASPASPPDYMRLPIETLHVGAIGTENALRIAARYGAGFLQASTSECYGDPLVHPQTESYWGHVNTTGPRSVYDEAKRYAEALTMAYYRARGVNTHLVRIFNTYGPRLRPGDGRIISNFMMQALRGDPLTIYGDGSQTRSFCYVSDLIEGIIRLAKSDEHLPVNIGNPVESTVLECAHTVLEVTGSTSILTFRELPEDDPTRRCPDISKACILLGWEPRVALREGLIRSLDHFMNKLNIPKATASVESSLGNRRHRYIWSGVMKSLAALEFQSSSDGDDANR